MKKIKVDRFFTLEVNMVLALSNISKVSQQILIYNIIQNFQSLNNNLKKYNGYESYAGKSGNYNEYDDLSIGYITIQKSKLKDLPSRLNNKVYFDECISELFEIYSNGKLNFTFPNGDEYELFEEFIIDFECCIFKFNSDIIPYIENITNDRFCQLHLGTMKQFKSISSVRLFELISLSKNINGRLIKSQCYIAKLLDKEEVTTSQLNRDIKGAIKDINSRIPEIKLDVEYDRHSKEYTFKYLKWSYKMEDVDE